MSRRRITAMAPFEQQLRRTRHKGDPELDDFDSDDNDSCCCCADEDLNDKSRDRGKRLRYSKTRLAVLVKPASKRYSSTLRFTCLIVKD